MNKVRPDPSPDRCPSIDCPLYGKRTRSAISRLLGQEEPSGDQEGGFLPIKDERVMFGNLVLIPTNPKVDPTPKDCSNCWQIGHHKMWCFRQWAGKYCTNFGRQLFTVSICLPCGAAHRQYFHMDQSVVDRTRPNRLKSSRTWQGPDQYRIAQPVNTSNFLPLFRPQTLRPEG